MTYSISRLAGIGHGSIKSCSNHGKYGDNPVSIDIGDTAHVGITDTETEAVGLWRYEKWIRAK